jgi:GNAT superfamily N-acetyltransferase
MLGGMEFRMLDPEDHDAVASAMELTNAALKVDAPFNHGFTLKEYALMLRHGWDGEVPETFTAWERGHLAGTVAVHTSEWDNTHLAWLEVLVHPDLRGGGRGSQMLDFAESRARELGRTSIGSSGWDHPGTHLFAAKHQMPRKASAIKRRQTLAHVAREQVEQMYAEAAAAASAYELLRIAGRTPDGLIAPVAELTAAINDAPLDDLDLEDEVFPVERVQAYEAAQVAREMRLYRVVARHRESGELAGHTVVVVDSERPWIGEQHDTCVVRDHRGHRLGLLLKSDMLRWLADVEPGLATIDTWNMESNDFMIGVNERLGYEVLGREIEFQRNIRG